MNDASQTLNDAQREAVTFTKGPLLIIAGAGTGKTTVITKRIEYLVRERKVSPESILALTFTDKAAEEMVMRLDKVMPYGYEEPWVSTFHSFCDRLLRTEALEIGLAPDYQLLDKTQQWLTIHDHIFDLGLRYYAPLNNPNKFIHGLTKFFSRLQDEDVTEVEMKDFEAELAKGKTLEEQETAAKYRELFEAFSRYNSLKLDTNRLDFGDLISWSLTLFRKRANILAKYRKKFAYILVDEFQDTNFAQLQLVKLLAPPEANPNLTVVGDDDQAIYAFRGSSVHNILDFKTHYPQAKEVLLTLNYRSGQPVLNAAYNTIINNNPDRLEERLKIDKKLAAVRGKKLPQPAIVETASLEEETEFVVSKILNLVGKDYTYKDIAILARANVHLDPFVSALRRSGIPYQLIGNRGLFDQEEIRDLLFVMKVAADTQDSTSLFQLLHNEAFGFNGDELLELTTYARRHTCSLWQCVSEKAQTDERFQNVVNLVTVIRQEDTKKPVSELIFDFIEKSQYLKIIMAQEDIENQLKIKNIDIFLKKIKRFDILEPHAGISECVKYFDLLQEAGENPAQAQIEDIDTVNLMTVHAAKGLEWGAVFLVNMVSDRFPCRDRHDSIELPHQFVKQSLPSGNEHLQEERRLFYVALTRARDYLFVTWGKDYGGIREKKPSPFLEEIQVKTTKWQSEAQLSWLSTVPSIPAPVPRRILDGKIVLPKISYSQIDTYNSCPLKYKYQYILGVPTRPGPSLSFGTAVHATLHQFHRFEMAGQKPSLETLLAHFEKQFIGIGYDSAEHRQRRLESGKKMLRTYYQTYENQFSGKPMDLEKHFRIIIDGVPLEGRIDRIDRLQNGFELIDYKTGSKGKKTKVDRDPQLTVYAMAAQALLGKIPDSLSLYFIEDNEKVETVRTADQIEKKKQDIAETIEAIQKGMFDPKPSFICQYCPFKHICPAAYKA